VLVKPSLVASAKEQVVVYTADVQHLLTPAEICDHLMPIRSGFLMSFRQLPTAIIESIR
jgi:hypothetical protein